MGRNHARVYQEIPSAQLVAVADANIPVLGEVSSVYRTRAYRDFQEMLIREKPDAVSIAVPTHLHFDITAAVLKAGCHALVEKPIAGTIEQARELIAIAAQSDKLLMIGHVERYNPAILDLKRRLEAGDLGRVFHIHARRLSPFPSRMNDIGVVLDLATHDVDIMRLLTGSEVARLYAETKQELHGGNEDLFNGLLRFQDDTLGLLEVGWLTPTKIRELYVTGDRGMFQANYLTQDLYFYENAAATSIPWGTLSILRGVSEGLMTRFPIGKKEPLRAELDAFLAAVNGENSDIVSGEDGLIALGLALALVKSGKEHQSLLWPSLDALGT